MARAIAKWVVLFAAVAMVADAQSAIACGVSPCENHGSRSQPADASGPTCPHSSTPSQPADDDRSCSHGEKTVKDGLLSAKSFYAAAYADHPLGVRVGERYALLRLSPQFLPVGADWPSSVRGGLQKRYGASSIFSIRTAFIPFLSSTTPFTLTDFSMNGINSAFACL